MLAGVLIGVLRAPFAIVVDAVSYVVSALFVFLIRRAGASGRAPRRAADGRGRRCAARSRSGLRYVTGHRWLRSIAATTGTSNFFGNVMGAILLLYLVRGASPPRASGSPSRSARSASSSRR